jgi:hypothetical protein
LAGVWVGCGGGVNSDEQARRAYLGLDRSIGKSLQLGFDGFNLAQSANISPQTTAGDATGTLTITGQVDQGNSANKGMRLRVGMVDYSEGPVALTLGDNNYIEVTYQTRQDNVDLQPFLQLKLNNILNGDFTGTLDGTYQMSGDVSGEVTLNLTMDGPIQDDGTGQVMRTPSATHVFGTATAGPGMYTIDITL